LSFIIALSFLAGLLLKSLALVERVVQFGVSVANLLLTHKSFKSLDDELVWVFQVEKL
jgi:hypothetical protein